MCIVILKRANFFFSRHRHDVGNPRNDRTSGGVLRPQRRVSRHQLLVRQELRQLCPEGRLGRQKHPESERSQYTRMGCL